MLFYIFCVFSIWAQGFSQKMHVFYQTTMFLNSFTMFFDSKTLNNFILDTFASENTTKLLFFFAFLDFGGWGWLEENNCFLCFFSDAADLGLDFLAQT